jgi:predicted O-methyltransferase YrrM
MTLEEITELVYDPRSPVADAEVKLWYNYVPHLPPGSVIVDQGTAFGKSACSMALMAPESTVYTIENFSALNVSGPEEFQEILDKKIADYGIKNLVSIRGSTLDIPWDKEIDFLNNDSDHSFEVTYQELKRWLPFVKKGGYICLHDWEHNRWPGISIAFNLLVYYEGNPYGRTSDQKFEAEFLEKDLGAAEIIIFRKL